MVKQKNIFHKILMILIFIGIYLNIHLLSNGNIIFPSVIATIFGIILLISNRNSIKSNEILILARIFLLIFIIGLLTPSPFLLFFERLKGFGQLSMHVMVGYSIYIEFKDWGESEISHFFFFFILLILFGTFFEINYDVIKNISDNFRNLVFQNDIIYNAKLRDLSLYSQIRPNFFASEPSHVSKFILICVFMWYTFSVNKYKVVISLLITLFSLFIIRSPIALLIPLIILITYVYSMRRNSQLFLIISLLFVFTIGIYIFLSPILMPRINLILAGKDISFLVRIIGPVLITLKSIFLYPFFGVGISGKELLTNVTYNTYKSLGLFLNTGSLNNYMQWSFFRYWVYFGIIGGLLVARFFSQFIKITYKGSLTYVFIIIFIYSATSGAFVNVRTISFIFLTVLSARKLQKNSYGF